MRNQIEWHHWRFENWVELQFSTVLVKCCTAMYSCTAVWSYWSVVVHGSWLYFQKNIKKHNWTAWRISVERKDLYKWTWTLKAHRLKSNNNHIQKFRMMHGASFSPRKPPSYAISTKIRTLMHVFPSVYSPGRSQTSVTHVEPASVVKVMLCFVIL
jgi:hypothetical protein